MSSTCSRSRRCSRRGCASTICSRRPRRRAATCSRARSSPSRSARRGPASRARAISTSEAWRCSLRSPDVREREAEQRDVPPFRVAPNAALYEAARRGARDVRDLARVRGLRGLDEAALAEALALAARGAPAEPEVEAPPPEERAARRAREKALSEWRRAEAERRGVDAQAVLPGHCLRDLARLGARAIEDLSRVEGLGDKRIARYGDALVRVLSA
ncbi:MAG: HRDC domain-containing protein [Sandaracinaceae bacterium]|nr:HRDC domain-containing protein [Sandaracinaceae bacterium]